jgi:hypothetical protein
VWALAHFAFWIFAGSTVWAQVRRTQWTWGRPLALLACLVVAIGWEILEAYVAPANHGLWGDWFRYSGFTWGGVCEVWAPDCHFESWWNSWVSDPLTCLAGVLLIWTLLDRKRP